MSDIIDTHWKQGAGYHTLHKITTQPLSWCPPLSTTNPDKSPTLGHPANHDMHQRTGQRRKAQAHKSHPGYGTQHAAPWGHTFAPPPDMSRLHTFTHQGSPTRLRPTRNNPPQPQILQRGRQARRSEDRRPMPWRITTSNHPDQQASDPTHHQPQKNHPHRDHTSTRGQRTGEPTASNKTPKPPRPHTNMKPPNHLTIWRPYHLPQPTPPHNPNTAHQDHPTQPGSTQHTQPTSRLEAAPPPQETTPWPVTPSQQPDTHHNQNPRGTTSRPPPPCSPCRRQQPA